MKRLTPFFTGRDMAFLKASVVRAYINQRLGMQASPATINREISLLSAAINYACREWDWVIPNPAAGRKLKEPEGRVRFITETEASRLIRVASKNELAPHLADFLVLALHTGMRSGEILNLSWDQVNLSSRFIILSGEETKSGRRRSIPLNTRAHSAVMSRKAFSAKWCLGSDWVFTNRKGARIQSVKTSFASTCKAVGIKDFRIHDLRHTCAAWLVTAGVPLTEVRDLLGHRSITMTERYAHLSPENVRAAVARIEG